MPRRMSCSMTVPAVRDRSKTVTRRHVATWKDLKPGDRLVLIEQGMGLPKGAHQVVLAEVEIVNVRVEILARICGEDRGPAREGLGHMTNVEFMAFWAKGHGYSPRRQVAAGTALQLLEIPCRRIEWRYL